MRKKALHIDLDELCDAMENSSYEHEYYLDLETGEILFVSECMDDEETGKDYVKPVPASMEIEVYPSTRADLLIGLASWPYTDPS